MKLKILLFVGFVLLFFACQQISKVDLEGQWIAFASESNEEKIYELNFSLDTVEWVNDHNFKDRGTYEIEHDILKITRLDDGFEIKTKAGMRRGWKPSSRESNETQLLTELRDSLTLFDSIGYYRDDRSMHANLEPFELIGISSDQLLSEIQDKYLFYIIHLHQSADQRVKLRLGDKIAKFEDLLLYLNFGSPFNPKSNRRIKGPLLYLGKGVQLKDLKEMYYYLAREQHNRIWIATKKEGIADYHLIHDKIYVWRDDIYLNNKYLSTSEFPSPPLPPPPPVEFTSKADFLSKGNQEIKINTKADFTKLNEMQLDKKYTVTINQDLPIEDYFELKSRVRALWKKKYFIIPAIE